MSAQNKFAYSTSDINIQRSRMDRSSSYKTTFNAGKLIPVYLDEVLPGDTFDMSVNVLARMSTPIFPVMDNAYMDINWFFVPNRLVWDHWKNFCGESANPWTSSTEYQVPRMPEVLGTLNVGSLADYFGLPLNVNPGYGASGSISALPFRGYRLIWNEWYRDQNLQQPLLVNTGDTETDLTLLDTLSVNKFHDYFTSCLPAPQKGPSTLIPGLKSSLAPVRTAQTEGYIGDSNPVKFRLTDGTKPFEPYNLVMTENGSIKTGVAYTGATASTVYPSNLVAVLSNDMLGTINELRQAFQVQKLLERDARGGTRYREMVFSHFGVTIPDSTVQVPEYLGGERFVLNMEQVIQNSESSPSSPLGSVSAYSKTIHTGGHFVKSFTEHGFLFGLACVRTNQSYSQGYDRMWTRKSRFDYYYPELAHIGEQPVLNREIYYDSSVPEGVFGYQEAWAEYRYKPSRNTGYFRPDVSGTLASWHYGENFGSAPILSSSFITASDQPLQRTLAVFQEDFPCQLLADFYFDLKCTRPMPMYSVPGLVDHF